MCFAIILALPVWGQDRYVPDLSKEVSLDDLARYLEVQGKVNKKTVEKAIHASVQENYGIARETNDRERQNSVLAASGAAVAAYNKKDYTGTVRALEQMREQARKPTARDEMAAWQKEAAAAVEQLEKLEGGQDMARELRNRMSDPLHRYMGNVEYAWPKIGPEYQAKLKAAQDWIAAEPERRLAAEKAAADKAAAERKAAEERAAAIAAANARGVTAADFEYDATRDGAGVVIKRYKGLASVVNIPAVIEGLPVRELEAKAFADNKEITSVTIPDSVTVIPGFKAQYESNRWGDDGAFKNCISLKTVTLPRGLKVVPGSLFAGCISLESVAIPSGVTAIGSRAFYRCGALTAVTLPAGLTSIGDSAFEDCKALTAITFPDSLTGIDAAAFAGCTGLTALVLPKNLKILVGGYVRYMGGGTFDNRPRMMNVSFQGGDLQAPPKNRQILAGGDIGAEGAFKNCTGLTSVTFQSRDLRVGGDVFAGCTSLSTLTINANTSLGGDSFSGCPITTVNIGPGVTRIDGVDNIPQGKLSLQAKAALNRLRGDR
ncbi:MAG: leucine-rich repeat domain-containing protein [Treponema sp.]|nr:leucine-rich repeat domain-containing protein [Treponema sp.]